MVVVPGVGEDEIEKLGREIGEKFSLELARRAKLERKKVTVSIGALITGRDDKGYEPINDADKLLYKAKEGGRNRMVMIKNGEEVVKSFDD